MSKGQTFVTCLLILEKAAKRQPVSEDGSNRVANVEEFKAVLATERFEHKALNELVLSDDR